MSLSIFFYDPKVALIGLSIFAISYFFLFKGVRNRLNKNGIAISEVNEERFRLMNEGFGGIKDLLLMGRDNDFINRFNRSGKTLAYSQGTNAALAQAPRYFVELLAFGSMIVLILYLIASHNGNLGMILPILSVYAIGIIKLLPAFQQIYSSIAIIKANIPAFESIQQDLHDSLHKESKSQQFEQNHLIPKHSISLENITFTYPNKEEPALNKLDMLIPSNSVIGIVGPSGSGKSTLIDILLCLIEPDNGNLKIDDEITIAENVAFGIPEKQINLSQVQKVLKLAHLSDFISTLDQGIYTKVGERGVQLSGGQRQRIGIARALYHNAEVLVFDEATSSLDGITEKMIMEAIHNFSGKKSIILIAHRLKTVKKCDKIFFIDKGRVADQGTYQELVENNKHFKDMAAHA
jgi:HlyD family secretion protein